MTAKQHKYILKQLQDSSICSISENPSHAHAELKTPIIKEILEKKYSNGAEMKAVLCFFDTLMQSTVQKKDGIYLLQTNMTKIVKNMKKLKVKSVEAYIYLSHIISKDIEVIIKVPKKKNTYINLVREYYIGIYGINNLRYVVPNFVYTLGAFLETKTNNAFIVYEHIRGDTLGYALQNNTITFEQFLNIFIQLLFALEIAQKNISFCHFDLHANNVILRPISKPYQYTLIINNYQYTITATDFIPTIIDYGMTTVNVKNKIIGIDDFSKFGMMHYMVQGADMYKLLFYCYAKSSGTLQRQIAGLLLFYGKYDPYKLLITPVEQIYLYTKEYVKKNTFSYSATFTPYDFINWILSNNFDITTIKKSSRNIYMPLNYSQTLQKYSNIFIETEQQLALDSCVELPHSYILLKYIQKIQRKTKQKFTKFNNIVQLLQQKKNELIQNDIVMLSRYTKIPLTDEIKINELSKYILSIMIGDKFSKRKIDTFIEYSQFTVMLSPYFQYLYTIRELGLNKQYSSFIKNFINSPQYTQYKKYIYLIEKTRRWSTTICNLDL